MNPWQSGRDDRLWRHLAALLLTALCVAVVLLHLPTIRNSPKYLISGYVKNYPSQGLLKGAAIGINNRRLSCRADLWASRPASCPAIAEGRFVSVQWYQAQGWLQSYPVAFSIKDEGTVLHSLSEDEVHNQALLSAWPLALPLGLALWLLLRPRKRAKVALLSVAATPAAL
jgi:hypothetical protein